MSSSLSVTLGVTAKYFKKYIIGALVVGLFFRLFLVSVYKSPSQKMAPTILEGDFILASAVSYGFKNPWTEKVYFGSLPNRGDLVVFNKNSKIYIKRVIAVALDKIEFINGPSTGRYSINSVECNYNFIEKTEDSLYSIYAEKCASFTHKIIKLSETNNSIQVPLKENNLLELGASELFVANDNRNLENDPNYAEKITIDQIIGKPLLVWMSYSSTQDFISNTLGVRWNRILTKLK